MTFFKEKKGVFLATAAVNTLFPIIIAVVLLAFLLTSGTFLLLLANKWILFLVLLIVALKIFSK